ncbi:hypothetical protein SJ05684_c23650 [Sinorhizobium sojae CCBAU 05684]|uniref:Uncharacterized protein n=1 Tax=Sinorhizobium sojae CCBAU 05684 TaxID=716928 RepID=A0A249PDF2_9HYPH|nr:hypothetical protein [Sinorhizobium sojae]ASY63805.1 hypothetical protein SJ05684_c23650 [Sinorhizobium sojae CCBAU 05684]
MADDEDAPTDQRPPFLARLSAIETIIVAAIALTALAGLMLIGKGFYLKATACLLEANLL